MVIIRYGSDAERKRVEYLLEKWHDRIDFKKPGGVAIILNGDEEHIKAFLQELLTKVPKDSVDIYRIEQYEIEAPYTHEVFTIETKLDINSVRNIVDFVMAKLRGALITETENMKRYNVYTRKGLCRVSIHLEPMDSTSKIRIELEGVDEAVRFLKSRLMEELEALKRVER